MSMRMVDLQTLLPRTQEASRAQEAAQRAPELAQQAAAQDLRKVADTRTRQVTGVEQAAGRRVRGSTEEERRRQRRARREPPSPVASHPEPNRGAAPARKSLVPGLGQHVDVRA